METTNKVGSTSSKVEKWLPYIERNLLKHENLLPE